MPHVDPPAEPRAHVPLAPFTTLRVGGAARWFVRAERAEEIAAAHAWAESRGLPLFVLGGGSNVVISDGGVAGLVLQVDLRGVRIRAEGDAMVVEAAAGEPWDALVARIVDAGYAGVEALSGIPGLTGGTPIQNVGAYGQEVSGTIEAVTAFDTSRRELIEISAADCGFAYRQSRFKQHDRGRFTICSVRLRLHRGSPVVTYPDVMTWIGERRLAHPTAADVRRAVLEIRRRKGMVLDESDPDTRSVGSFFMNPVVPRSVQTDLGAPSFPLPSGGVKVPAAWLIERAGVAKGYALGAAAVSSKHPLAIVNRGGASSSEIVDLAVHIKRRVLDRFGIVLRPEPVFVGFAEDERVRFLQGEVA